MRPCGAKRTRTCSRITIHGKKLLFGQQQLTTKQVGTKNEQCGFFIFSLTLLYFFWHFRSNNPAKRKVSTFVR